MSNAAVALAIKVTADARAAAAGIDDVSNRTRRMGQAGRVAGRLLAVGLAAAAVAGFKAAEAAAADQAAQAQYATALRNSAGATDKVIASSEAWIATQGKLFGVADDELRPALTGLVSATNDVAKAQKLASLAQDIAATRGLSLESVSKKLAKAVSTGSASALAQYGVQVKDAYGDSRSLGFVIGDLADKYKNGAAKQAETAAGKTKIFKVQMAELQEQIGTGLIPVLTKASSVGLEVVDWISKNQTAALAIIGTLGTLLVIVKAVTLAVEVYTAVTKIATGVQAAFNIITSANPIAILVLSVIAIGAALVIAYKRSETFRDIVNAVFKAISTTVDAVVGFIRDHWKLLLAILTGPIGLAVLAISKHWDTIKAGAIELKDKIAGYATTIKEALVGAFEAVIAKVQAVYDKILSAIAKAKDLAAALTPGGDGAFIGGGRALNGSSGGPKAPLPNAQSTSSRTVTINNFGAVIDRYSLDNLTTVLRRETYAMGATIG